LPLIIFFVNCLTTKCLPLPFSEKIAKIMSDYHHLLSRRVAALSESATLEMTRKSRELKEQGIDVITLSIGEPDFNTPEAVKNAGIQAIRDNKTHYPPVPGTNALRQAIAQKLKRDNGLDYKPSQIIVSTGAKQSIMNAFFSLLNPGDEVIIPAPYWVSYPDMVKMAEGVPVYISSTVDTDFKISADQLENAITKKTKAIIFSSPCNPSGSVYELQELEAFAKVLERNPDVFVISDEIYEYIRFEGEHSSIASFESIRDRVILINGLSKGFAMTGWRLGFMAAHQDIANACNTIQGQYTSGTSSISQEAAVEAFNTVPSQSEDIKQMVTRFKQRGKLLFDRLSAIPGIIPNKPKGAFYLFPDISAYFGKCYEKYQITDSKTLALYLLAEAHVALVSGDAFGCDQCIRFSFAASEVQIETACNRIEAALKKLS
jgi:aspartate aminotransferase